jgi:RimJ/RimL family protein N-acetyltransferase
VNAVQPARSAPQRVALEGRYTRLEPMAAAHADSMFAAVCDAEAEARHHWLSMYPPADVAELRAWIETAAASRDDLYFAVIDRATGRCGGRHALMRQRPEHGSVEIGGVLWGQGIARTRLATEAFYLTARYIFDDLGYRRFEWKCNDRNEPSKAAARRFGFQYEGLFRQDMIVKGENRDTAWFSILDGEWPALRAEYERWLDPANFTEDGMQKTRLAAAR